MLLIGVLVLLLLAVPIPPIGVISDVYDRHRS